MPVGRPLSQGGGAKEAANGRGAQNTHEAESSYLYARYTAANAHAGHIYPDPNQANEHQGGFHSHPDTNESARSDGYPHSHTEQRGSTAERALHPMPQSGQGQNRQKEPG